MRRYEVQTEGSKTTLKIKGSIDESFEFPEDLKGETLIIDFEEMKTFNSMGIRLWLVWNTKNKNAFKKIHLINCRPRFVDQIAYIHDIIPAHAVIDSFYVPFYDPKDDSGKEVKMVRGIDFDSSSYKVPTVESPNGGMMELDVPDRYFGFLKVKA